MKHYLHPVTFTDGIVHGYAADIKLPRAPLLEHVYDQVRTLLPRAEQEGCLVVTSNGKVWSYAIRPRWVMQPNGMAEHFRASRYVPSPTMSRSIAPSRSALQGTYREPLAWALKDMARRARLPASDPNSLQLNVAYDREAPAETGTSLPGPFGPIKYTGYSDRVGQYSLDQIHAAVVSGLEACAAQWRWRSAGEPPWNPNRLEVMLHSGQKALGLAYAPGTGRDGGRPRVISLNARLFKEYDLHATWRVVVHELCHHYRDEVFSARDVDQATADRVRMAVIEKQRQGHRVPQEIFNTHDSIFIRELARVDSKVDADPYSGIFFTEYADPSLVAQIAEKKAAALAKVDWSIDKGRLHLRRLKDGTLSMTWLPIEKGAWKPVTRKLQQNLECGNWILKLMGARVTTENWMAGYDPPQTINDFLAWLDMRGFIFRRTDQ